MVYESDFYTTRRPYSRPNISSYSVTSPIIRTVYPGSRVTYTTTYPIYSYNSIPYVAHKRLVYGTRILTSPTRIITTPGRVISSPVRILRTSPIRVISTPIRQYRTSPVRVIHSPSPVRFTRSSVSPVRIVSSPARIVSIRTRPSILYRAYDSILNRYRSHPGYYPTEEYLNSRYSKEFDDETRDIRATTSAILNKIHSPVPRAQSLSPLYRYPSRYEPRRYAESITREISGYPWYPEPIKKFSGKSHLASVRICGDIPYTTRKPLCEDYSNEKVRNDINLLSFYSKNLKAAKDKKELPPPLESVNLQNASPASEILVN